MSGRARGLGRVEHFDPRNLNHLIEEAKPRMATREAIVQRRTKRHYIHPARKRMLDQGQTPRCTAYGSEMYLYALPISHPERLLNPDLLYERIVAIDRAEGRHYSAGATTLAAMKALQREGYVSGYDWTYEPEVAFNTVSLLQSVVLGTNWYASMYERDAEGICRIRPRSPLVGGHLFAVNGYILRPDGEDLLRIPNTWGDGDYYLPVSDAARLIFEDGEVALPVEVRR